MIMKVLKFIIFSVLLINFSGTFLFAYNISYKTNTYLKNLYFLEGSISSMPITVYLIINKNSQNAYGAYYYDRYGDFIQLRGSLANNTLKLTEYVDGKDNATIEGRLSNNLNFKGTFFNKTTSRSFSMEVMPSKTNPIQFIQIKTTEIESGDNLSISDEIPQIYNPQKLKGIEKINNDFKEMSIINRSIYEYSEAYDYYIEIENSQNNDYNYEPIYEFNSKYDIVYQDKNILSFENFYSEYTGGAHVNSIVTAFIYDINSGERINEKATDLLYTVEDAGLIKLLREKLLEFQYSSKNMYFDFDDIRLNNNYYASKTGITFIYVPYEIAPYGNGYTYIHFTYEELKPFVKRNSKLWYLFNQK